MPPSKQFNPEEFAATIARVSQGTDHGIANQRPDYDHKQAREFKASAVGGRKIADYKPALEAMGFTFVPAEYLPLC